MRQLSSLDTQFVVSEDGRNHTHIVAASVYDPSTAAGGTLTVERMRELVAERLHLLPVFRWRLVDVPFGIDYPYWAEDVEFDPEFHIREAALPPPGDVRQFADLVARIASLPLDRARPLWELRVIHGLEHGHVGLVTKMHHAAVDGIAGTEVLTVLLDSAPDGRTELAPAPPPTEPVPAPGELAMLARGLAGVPRQPLRALRSAPRAVRHLDDAALMRTIPGVGLVARLGRAAFPPRRDGGLLERPKFRAPRIVVNGRISPHRRVAFGSLSLDTVKQIKNALGVTVNDVLVAVCAGALREWLQERGELPEESLVALIPVSVRTAEEQGTFGNRVSMMCVPIATDEPDPRARALRVHESLRSAKERHRALPVTLLQDANNFVPPALFARAARASGALLTQSRIEPPANVLISNVPGSPTPVYCAGARQVATYPASAIFDAMALNITVLSYQRNIDVGIVVDREQVNDPWALLDAMHEALNTLAAAATPAGASPSGQPAAAGA
jgi:diacylglycerol O-acyltransferase / wax synthase